MSNASRGLRVPEGAAALLRRTEDNRPLCQPTHVERLMSDCCSSSGSDSTHPNKLRCPINGKQCAEFRYEPFFIKSRMHGLGSQPVIGISFVTILLARLSISAMTVRRFSSRSCGGELGRKTHRTKDCCVIALASPNRISRTIPPRGILWLPRPRRVNAHATQAIRRGVVV